MTRDEQLLTFERFNLTEKEVADIVARCIALDENETLPYVIRGCNVEIDQNFNIRYKRGKRFPMLERAIKDYILNG